MPIYEYECKSCRHHGELLQKMTDPAVLECPQCGAHVFERQVSAAGFQLKGAGWYVTDFKNKPTQSASTATGEGSKSDKPAEKTPGPETTSDSKS